MLRVLELALVVHLLLDGLAFFREGWKDRPVSVGRNCREGFLVFSVAPYRDQLRESLFSAFLLLSNLEPVRWSPVH